MSLGLRRPSVEMCNKPIQRAVSRVGSKMYLHTTRGFIDKILKTVRPIG